MELSRESPRVRWSILAIAWAALAVLLVLHTLAVRDYVDALDRLGRRGAAEVGTPLQRPMPTLFADAQTWVRHALTLLETDAWRVRHTDIDNAPHGRPVHWCSGFAWLIAGGGWLEHLFTGEPLPLAVERSLAWFNAPLLLAVVILFSAWTARRAGAAAGVFVACALVGHNDFYGAFDPNFADHHGLLAAANFGVVLGAVFMGAGWWRAPREGEAFGNGEAAPRLLPASRAAARGAAIFSALCGAVGMWISAASVTPAIGIVGVAAVLATWWRGRALRAAGAAFDGDVWRTWARWGAGASFLFYLIEYAPHFDLRLEVNHPLYALAWWGGGEFVALACEARLGARRAAWRWALALAAIAAPAAAIALGGAKVFVIRDPVLLEISARVSEGISLPRALALLGSGVLTERLPWLLAMLAALVLLWRRRERPESLLLAFAALVAVAFLGLAWFQIRFFTNAAGPQVALLLVALAALTAAWRPGAARLRQFHLLSEKGWERFVFIAGAVLACLPARLELLHAARETVRARQFARRDLLQPLYRDIAAALRAAQPAGDIVLLTNPDASNAIGYYGRLKTIGTLYWENLDGMKAAAAMSSVRDGAEARALLAARRVTHIAVISEASFVPEFYELAHPGAPAGEWQQSLAYQLFSKQNVPAWLEEIPYEPPADTRISDLRVVLFKTLLGPPAAEEALVAARAQVQAGNFDAAEPLIARGLAAQPTNAELLVLRVEVQLARGAADEALATTRTALTHVPAAQRAAIAGALANRFYQRQAAAAAMELYRASLAARYDATLAANLAWILATSRDDRLRDAKAALELAQRVAAENPSSYQATSALAAALAESARFNEAVAVATRSVELARATGDANLALRAEARLRAYREGKPWRQ